MARIQDPNRDVAYKMYKSSNGTIENRRVAEKLNVPERTIAAWKARDNWKDKLAGKESFKKKRMWYRKNKKYYRGKM